jgi:hypothetical protein
MLPYWRQWRRTLLLPPIADWNEARKMMLVLLAARPLLSFFQRISLCERHHWAAIFIEWRLFWHAGHGTQQRNWALLQ